MTEKTENTKTSAGLRGIWGLEQLERARLPTAAKMGVLLGLCTSVPVLLFFGLGEPSLNGLLLFAASGWNNGLLLCAMLYSLPHIQRSIESGLQEIDPSVTAMAVKLAPGKWVLVWPVIGIVVIHSISWQLNLANGGPDIMNIGALSRSDFAFHYGASWIAWAGAGIVLSGVPRVLGYLVHVARHVRVDLLRVNQYACLTTPALWAFGASSLLAATISVITLFVASDVQQVLTGFAAVIIIGASCITGVAMVPVLIFRNRVASLIRSDVDCLRMALSKEPVDMTQLNVRLTTQDPQHADLTGQWLLLDSLPEWPIGPHLQKFVVFGVLPPLAWVMAAIVENTLF